MIRQYHSPKHLSFPSTVAICIHNLHKIFQSYVVIFLIPCRNYDLQNLANISKISFKQNATLKSIKTLIDNYMSCYIK